ncbi:SDR family NAD(P)-dependent oxidoreductase [Lactococcus hircilactis]|uniref:SDR family NAD(P)-dependent oxidoreductase n=1 Tax=Lactococcus hircilactis TaxID=1494462 RepID=A0A7X1Z9Z0_9LACT|nr:SDR family NAD(P)-dependent oxidoreductase [Lactococcus hircilactis]MQW40595.1 SDR family NAD(P)-dependent oxidoreductase [Lactococcus hircilactis]
MKTIMITGGTSGVGKAIAKNLASIDGSEIILVGRNEKKAQHATLEIQNLTGNHKISYLLADLSDQKALQNVAKIFDDTHDQLDVLIHSAGVFPQTKKENIEVNLRSHYQLTHALLPALSKSKNAQIFIITGQPKAIQCGVISEHQETLLQRGLWLLTHKTLLVKWLAEELNPTAITVNALFAGDVKSDLMPWTQTLKNQDVSIAKPLITSAQYQGLTGQFFDQYGMVVKLSDEKYNATRAKQLLSEYINF